MEILVTGGTGYIGSHTCVELIRAGHQVTIVDNLSNSSVSVVDRIATLAGKRPAFLQADIRDRAALATLFASKSFAAVIHFAGLKNPAESIQQPVAYYDTNVGGSICLIEAMQAAGIKTLVFSSSAAVYGNPSGNPIPEEATTCPLSPYGHSKRTVEQILGDLQASDASWKIACLRYFNPLGAHPSALLGEIPNTASPNLLPALLDVALARRPSLSIFGGAHPTPDGTCIRDFIHVCDLASGHLAALEYLAHHPGIVTVNLGTGRGCSVLELRRAFERASGKAIPAEILPPRAGDPSVSYADVTLAARLLGWRATRTIDAMCADAWRWAAGYHADDQPPAVDGQ